MTQEIVIPSQLPVMTLANTVFFPHAMLPLYIFEPRYRQMLTDVLAGDRLFVVAREDVTRGQNTGEFEPPYPMASVGVVRASHQEDDGTSHLILQGLARVRFTRIIREEPYRLAEFEAIEPMPSDDNSMSNLRRELAESVDHCQQLGNPNPSEVFEFLKGLDDPVTYLDLASFTLCEDSDIKQSLLETLDPSERYQKLLAYLRSANEQRSLEIELLGDLDEDNLDRN